MNTQKAGLKLLFSAFIVLATTFPLLGAGQQASSLFDRELLSDTSIQSAFRYIDSNREAIVQEWIKLTEIPAPSTMEDRRAAYIREQLEAIGVDQISIDEKGNMIATLKGSGGGPTVALAAHMDTVFDVDTPIKVRREEERLYAPGVGDDTSGCIGLLWAVRALKDAGIQTKGDFLAVFTVEEELGLFGARKFLEDWEDRLDMFVAVDGALGRMSYGALGISWYKFIFTSEGSHTNRSAGKPNPAKAIASAISQIYTIPLQPPGNEMGTVYNVGLLGGGKVFNAISEESFFTVDVRSADPEKLEEMESKIRRAAENAAEMEGVRLRVERPLILPAAQISGALDSAIVQTGVDVLDALGIEAELTIRGSTDANVAMEMGIPSISIGAARGERGHQESEAVLIEPMYDGIKQMLLLMVSLAGQ